MRPCKLAFLALLTVCGLSCPASTVLGAQPYPYRLVWLWGGMENSKGDALQPAKTSQYVELASQLRSMNVNGLVLPLRLSDREPANRPAQIRAASKLLSGYGIGTYLYMHYSVPRESTSSLDPKNCPFSPEFAKRWDTLGERLFTEVPLLRGYVIKGMGYERIPGPLSCRCSVCRSKTEPERMLKALNVLSDSVKKRRGVILYRSWMTGAIQDKECKLFAALSGKLPRNVFIVSKIGYGDFGIKEIPHPLFGHIQPASQHIAEFQVFGEYRGRFYNPCEMVTNWGEWTRANKDLVGGVIGDVVLGNGYLDHPLNMVNWCAFGRYASNPDSSPDQIIDNWSREAYGKNAAGLVTDVVKRTSGATSKMMYFKGVWIQRHSWLPTPRYLDSHLRGPWVDMERNTKLIGWGRPLDLFDPEKAAEYAKDPDLELFTHRKEVTPALMGELSKQQDEAVADYEAMLAKWRQGKDLMGKPQYLQVERLLEASLNDSRIWRLNVRAFISFLLGKDCKPYVDEMQQLAMKTKGTALTSEPLAEVLDSYRN